MASLILLAALRICPAATGTTNIETVVLRSGREAEVTFRFDRSGVGKPRLLYKGNKLMFLFPGIGFKGNKPVPPGSPFTGTKVVSDETGTRVEVFLDTRAGNVLPLLRVVTGERETTYRWRQEFGNQGGEQVRTRVDSAEHEGTSPARKASVEATHGTANRIGSASPVATPPDRENKQDPIPGGGTSGRVKKPEEKKEMLFGRTASNRASKTMLGSSVRAGDASKGGEESNAAVVYGALLAIVLVLAGAVVLWNRRGHGGPGPRRGIEFLGARSIGPKQNVVLLKVMDRVILVGSSEKGLVLLSEFGQGDCHDGKDERSPDTCEPAKPDVLQVNASIGRAGASEVESATGNAGEGPADAETLKTWLQGI